MKRPVGRPPKKPIVWYHDFQYQAGSWNRPRRVVAKVEWHQGELFPRVGFIATAAYGSYLDSHVETLRDFRDQYLVTNPVGSGLISLYYKLSPPLAEFIDDHPALKPIVRAALMPAVAMSAVAVSTTLAEKLAIVGVILLVSAWVVVWGRHRRVSL